jgi:hypothetical protein
MILTIAFTPEKEGESLTFMIGA